jgi:Ser-tRNA(Ala) deacylase AlaX
MSKLVAIKIDVSKIDKARLYQGAKGQYLDATVFLNEEQGQYGDNGMITQSVSKEERESGVKGNILGNVKILGEFGDNKGGASAPAASSSASMDDIPF